MLIRRLLRLYCAGNGQCVHAKPFSPAAFLTVVATLRAKLRWRSFIFLNHFHFVRTTTMMRYHVSHVGSYGSILSPVTQHFGFATIQPLTTLIQAISDLTSKCVVFCHSVHLYCVLVLFESIYHIYAGQRLSMQHMFRSRVCRKEL